MCVQLLGFLLFACQIILNESSVIVESENSVRSEAQSAIRPCDLPVGYVSFPDVHAAYKIHEKSEAWYDARDKCTAEGAHLAIPDTVNKIKHINSLKTYKSANKWLHVGIYKVNHTTPWVRVDNGLPLTCIPWIEGNPDGSGNCAGISVYKDGLVDYGCNWSGEFYVCEISILDD